MSGVVPEIVSRSLPEANDDIVHLSPRCAIVSIGAPGTPPPYGFQRMNPLHLRLHFHDLVEGVDGMRPPGQDDVRQLLDHAPILRTAELVYCHCFAGISRSTAAAYVLRSLWLGPGRESEALQAVFEDRPIADPNRLVVAHADRLMERGGALLAALDAR